MSQNVTAYVAYTRKALIQILVLIITIGTAILTTTTLPDKWAALITAVVGGAGSIVHFLVPNAEAPGTALAIESPEAEDDEHLPEFTNEELVTRVHENDTSVPPFVGRHEAPTP